MKESLIQKEIMDYLKARDIFHWRTPNLPWGNRKNIVFRGVSDILGFYCGKFFAIEIKKPGGRLSKEQEIFLNAVKNNGQIAVVAYSVNDIISVFKELKNGEIT